MESNRRFAFAIAAVLAALGPVGCSSPASGGPAPLPPPRPSTSPTAGPAASSEPAAPPDLPPIASVIPHKARAITVPLRHAAPGVARNDHVDVLAALVDPATKEPVVVTVLQNVIVLAVDGADRVTLLVLPEEAEILTLGAQFGGVVLTLRNVNDVDVQEERGRATTSTLLSGERARALQQRRSQTIQIIRGKSACDPNDALCNGRGSAK